jgi:hypothetical protein
MGRERFLFVPFPLPCGSALGILTYPVGRVGVIHPSAWNRNSAKLGQQMRKITHLGDPPGSVSRVR